MIVRTLQRPCRYPAAPPVSHRRASCGTPSRADLLARIAEAAAGFSVSYQRLQTSIADVGRRLEQAQGVKNKLRLFDVLIQGHAARVMLEAVCLGATGKMADGAAFDRAKLTATMTTVIKRGLDARLIMPGDRRHSRLTHLKATLLEVDAVPVLADLATSELAEIAEDSRDANATAEEFWRKVLALQS